MGGAQVVGRSDEVVEVGREVGVLELSVAVAETGEVEAQHAEAPVRKRARDAGRGREVLGAGEAVREQRGGADRADGVVVARVERCTKRPGEG